DYPLDANEVEVSDIFFLATHIESRMDEIYYFFNTTASLSLKVNARIYTTKDEVIDSIHKACPSLTGIKSTIPYDSNLKFAKHSDLLLYCAHNIYKSRSIVFFEAIGFDNKLITTNKFAHTYNLYNPVNILVLYDCYTVELINELIDMLY